MKMQRSHCENENVHFVQELAEVDGPFESPININFRDLTKLELPSLVWNRAEVSPKKMKITNTGHTVIISGKWKCERPYLTGGPLSGKYVFSQIHFHWGQDDCKGSEHQVCGEGFPLEMHVAHFKTEYLTQECALREKDGMVVVVYLFKLQEEPNASLKKILNLLPCVKQASTSHAVDPRPILSLCNPFTDDYFMYWGSVVTSTCAHILLWIICREPFGISREQVKEFRKILDTSHQPICKNSRDIQPLHRRNVFHVNASKHLEDALLPVKKVLGCYCKGSEDNISSKSATKDCNCQAFMQNQEDVEGHSVENAKRHHCSDIGGKHGLYWKASLPGNCFAHHSIFVQTATIHSVPVFVKRFDSEPVGNHCCLDNLKQTKSEGDTQLNPVSKSCCFFTTKNDRRIKSRAEKRKKKPFNSMRAFSHLMDSLEALKNQTFKKLKEIESINQEIKGMKPFYHDSEDKRWLRRIEKIITRQKRFTLKSSQGCLSELKKLARECNFDKFFDGKELPVGDNNQKMMWLNDNEIETNSLPYSYKYMKGEDIPKMNMTSSKNFSINKTIKFSTKAQRLIQSFFEDIKENDELQETVKKDLSMKKIASLCNRQAGDSTSVTSATKGYITQKMFTLGNLGDRFFTAVSTDDFEVNENQWPDKKETEEVIIIKQEDRSEKITHTEKQVINYNPVSKENISQTPKPKNQETILLHRANVVIENVKASAEAAEHVENFGDKEPLDGRKGEKILKNQSDSESLSSDEKQYEPYSIRGSNKKSLRTIRKELCELTGEKLLKELEAKIAVSNLRRSSSNLSTASTETQQMIIAKIRKRQSRKDIWEKKSSVLFIKASSKKLYEKNYKKKKLKNVNFEGYYIQKKNLKKRKSQRIERMKGKTLWDFSSTSKEETKAMISKSKWKRLTKAKFRLEIEKSSESTVDSAVENSLASPERKKLKLEYKRTRTASPKQINCQSANKGLHVTKSCRNNNILSTVSPPPKFFENRNTQSKEENLVETQTNILMSKSAESQQNTIPKATLSKNSTNDSRVTSRTSASKAFRTSSADSKISCTPTLDLKTSEKIEPLLQIKTEVLKQDFQNLASLKPISKNRSLSSLTTTSKLYPTEINQRIFMETIDDRRQSLRDMFELRKTICSPKKVEEKDKIVTGKNLHSETSNETEKKFDEELDQKDQNQSSENMEKIDSQAVDKVEYDIKFFTTPNQINEELLPKTHLQEGKGKTSIPKCCDAGKYDVLEKSVQENNEVGPELSQRTDSNKSFSKNASKSDADLAFPSPEDSLPVDNKELQVSVSYSTLKKNSSSRHHSAETLISLTKSLKRKSKKRPHCCKRSSKHYIRKNSSIPRKPNKVDSKPPHLVNLTDEEQLKIISANVAKYLKQKLVEQNTKFDPENNCSFKDIEEVVFNNLVASREQTKETPLQETCAVDKTEIKKEKPPIVKSKQNTKTTEKKPECTEVTSVIKPPEEPKKEKLASTVVETGKVIKPVHNFIKRNKQMAGKYKRTAPLAEKNNEVKKKEEKPKKEAFKVKSKNPGKKKDQPENNLKQDQQAKSTSEGSSSQKNQKLFMTEKSKKANRIKSPRTPKKPEPKNQKTKKKPKSPEPELEPEPIIVAEQSNQLVECTNVSKLPAPIVLRKIPRSKKRLVPAYMVTSYLPAPIEIVESQTRKMNKYLLSMSNTNLENYLPEVLHEAKNRKREGHKSDALFEKELEYLIKLQMCLNEEITTNIENSMNYVKTLLSPDYPLSYFDSSNNKGVVLVEMKDVDCSSSGSDITEDISKYYLGKESSENKNENISRNKQLPFIKMPKESGDPGILSPIQYQEKQEDFNSDSSYDCKISITLNANTKEKDGELQSNETLTYLGENSNSQTTIYLEGSSSQSTVTKPHRKKRKENEISTEMKQKLLEILEGEIKREIAIAGGASSEVSSDNPTNKWEDSDGNNRSQSTESSCDNMEMLTQISETMRQYLSDFKERRLEEIIIHSSDKESKDDESAC